MGRWARCTLAAALFAVLSACSTSHGDASVAGSATTASSPPGVTEPSSTPIEPSATTTLPTEENPRLVTSAVSTFRLPAGWHDDTDPAQPTAVIASRVLPSGDVLVAGVFDPEQPAQSVELGSEQYRKSVVTMVLGPAHGKAVTIPGLTIAGRSTVGMRTTVTSDGATEAIRLYMLTTSHRLYVVVLGALPEDASLLDRDFRSMLRSWLWTK